VSDERAFALDHIVLTERDIEATSDWYERVLGLRRVVFDGGRVALHFGSQKINLHPSASPLKPHAAVPEAGAADLCFLTKLSIPEIEEVLEREQVRIELGPVEQTGARGRMESVYVRDPDGNLIEIAHYR
jgi:catechol 2,3-dioxygenase-like lactoylglutathione lyase family enzyme